ncbi:hypothetical protein [Natronorubrum thiooxidans]|uniref:Uncharacterized protein n=1 Tax=Natronorubrum thiooxidans TaxID=308853 RepID=A0A1N7GLZ7_9EURY|nr:hypothetical protein [Natronorubrum thiooxidans]SIS13569.1 hypothetical protein SAMN05421752_11364 [Natronorubrum thiooxidans]
MWIVLGLDSDLDTMVMFGTAHVVYGVVLGAGIVAWSNRSQER